MDGFLIGCFILTCLRFGCSLTCEFNEKNFYACSAELFIDYGTSYDRSAYM